MTVDTRGMSDAARELLVTSLQPSDQSNGLLTLTETLGGSMHITAGSKQWTFGRGEGSEYASGFQELLDAGLIRETEIEGTLGGCMVTPPGVEAAQLLQWPPV